MLVSSLNSLVPGIGQSAVYSATKAFETSLACGASRRNSSTPRGTGGVSSTSKHHPLARPGQGQTIRCPRKRGELQSRYWTWIAFRLAAVAGEVPTEAEVEHVQANTQDRWTRATITRARQRPQAKPPATKAKHRRLGSGGVARHPSEANQIPASLLSPVAGASSRRRFGQQQAAGGGGDRGISAAPKSGSASPSGVRSCACRRASARRSIAVKCGSLVSSAHSSWVSSCRVEVRLPRTLAERAVAALGA